MLVGRIRITSYNVCYTKLLRSGVHPHIADLINNLDPDIQKKCLLYHYDGEPKLPDTSTFFGILRSGDYHIYPPPNWEPPVGNKE